MNKKRKEQAVRIVKARVESGETITDIAHDIDVYPMAVWRAYYGDYAAPQLIKALQLGRRRHRRAGEFSAERVGEFDAMCKRKGTSATTILNDWLDWHKGVECGKLKILQAFKD